MKLRKEDMYQYDGFLRRDRACKALEQRFAIRYEGFKLIWDEPYKEQSQFQKFQLCQDLGDSNEKLRFLFIDNGVFDNDEMDAFLNEFERCATTLIIKSGIP